MTSATVSAASSDTDFWGTLASDIQTNISVAADGKITGTLKKLTSGQLVTDWGEGYFIGLGFDNFSTGVTYSDVQVCINPTEGAGWVTLDSDKLAVFKVTNKAEQKIGVKQTKGETSRIDYYDLSGLTLS